MDQIPYSFDIPLKSPLRLSCPRSCCGPYPSPLCPSTLICKGKVEEVLASMSISLLSLDASTFPVEEPFLMTVGLCLALTPTPTALGPAVVGTAGNCLSLISFFTKTSFNSGFLLFSSLTSLPSRSLALFKLVGIAPLEEAPTLKASNSYFLRIYFSISLSLSSPPRLVGGGFSDSSGL